MAMVRDILARKGPSIIDGPPDATVGNVVRKMVQANVGSMVVVEDQQILGIFTERDLLFRVVGPGRNAETTRIMEVMSSPVRCCRPEDSLQRCAEILLGEHFRHLVVAEAFGPVGLISFRDVMREALLADEGSPLLADDLLRDLQPI